MAFRIKNLNVLAYANGFTLYLYKTGVDTLWEIKRAGYFNEGSDMLTRGDMILTTGSDGGTIRLVASVDGDGVITVPLS